MNRLFSALSKMSKTARHVDNQESMYIVDKILDTKRDVRLLSGAAFAAIAGLTGYTAMGMTWMYGVFDKRFDKVEADITEIKQDIAEMKTDISWMKDGIQEIKTMLKDGH